VPHLTGLRELLPAQSQREEILELREALNRVPLRILVLLDEIDRMQREELQVLLKVLRGASTMPNVTFVCAFSQEHVVKELGVSADYLEKFFPISVNVSAPNQELVGRLFQARLTGCLNEEGWFKRVADRTHFKDLLQEVWQTPLSELCTNLRKAALLLNDILTAARPIIGEVSPLDLVAIEAVRRFHPEVYHLVKTNRSLLTYGSNTWSKYEYRSEQETRKRSEKFVQDVKQADKSQTAHSLLSWLFPYYVHATDQYRRLYTYTRPTNEDIAENEKRICSFDYFPIYFRGEVPEEMFSDAELNRLVSNLNGAGTDAEVERVFSGVLDSIPPSHPKREDFLWKLSQASDRLGDAAAERLAYAASDRAADYAYDRMNIGEAAQALNIVFRAAQKLASTSTAQQVLEGAMSRASDDTFALRLLEFTENRDRNKVLTDFSNINAGAVREGFMARMRQRYGSGKDIQGVNIRQADWSAFRLWAGNSADDGDMEREFWRRFIGGSRKRLAQAMNFAFPSGFSWPRDPAEIVNNVFPVDEFRQLLHDLPEGEPLNAIETKAIDRMERLIAGTWQGEFPGLNVS
jgi:KAP family P-loop domain